MSGAMDKLVRDLIPEQLVAKGVAAQVSRYDDAAFLEALRAARGGERGVLRRSQR